MDSQNLAPDEPSIENESMEETDKQTKSCVRKRDRQKMKKQADSSRIASKRKKEDSEEKQLRLSSNAKRNAIIRSQETPQVKINRLQKSNEDRFLKRSLNSAEEKEKLKDCNRKLMRDIRTAESDEVKVTRKKAVAQRNATTRAQETIAQTMSRRRSDLARKNKNSAALLGIASTSIRPITHHLGRMDQECSFCNAKYFKCETTQQGKFNSCCMGGAVKLEQKSYPLALKKLFLTNKNSKDKELWKEAKNFKENCRQYNNSLAMASMKSEPDKTMPKGGPYVFRIHEQVYHFVGNLHPENNLPRKFAQIYFLDTEQAAAELAGREMNSSCTKEIFEKLIGILQEHHPHTKSFKMMFEVEKEEKEKAKLENRPEKHVKMIFQVRSQDDQRRYQNSTANEVAVVYVGDDDEIPGTRGITIYQKDGGLRSIHVINPHCDPMTYPLLFPTGQFGWSIDIKYTRERGKKTNVTMREFYSYHLHVRPSFSPLFRSGKLFQQYVVDVWTRVEQNRLNYIRNNQNMFHMETLRGLQDYVIGDETGPVGTRIKLPSSFKGSPRDMVQQYQDAMAVVARYGKPDFFLTMTCNPNWDEIQENLYPGQTASDRPDIVARVFQLKVEELKKDLFQRNVLGEVLAYVYVIEFQKRGLPHMHMLMIMKSGSKLRTAADVDRVISAELPDKNEDPELYELVSTTMMHRPCGVHNPQSPCMKQTDNGKICEKKFPKAFRETTSTETEGFPAYRRRDNGRGFEYKIGNDRVMLTNEHVVPFNPWILRKFKCHVNLEACGTVSAVKYIYKYVYKGTTRAAIQIKIVDGKETEVIDEVKQYHT